jgi:hypothetical protein
MEKGSDQVNLKRAPLCGKLHKYTKETRTNTPMAFPRPPSLSLVAACLSRSGHG